MNVPYYETVKWLRDEVGRLTFYRVWGKRYLPFPEGTLTSSEAEELSKKTSEMVPMIRRMKKLESVEGSPLCAGYDREDGLLIRGSLIEITKDPIDIRVIDSGEGILQVHNKVKQYGKGDDAMCNLVLWHCNFRGSREAFYCAFRYRPDSVTFDSFISNPIGLRFAPLAAFALYTVEYYHKEGLLHGCPSNPRVWSVVGHDKDPHDDARVFLLMTESKEGKPTEEEIDENRREFLVTLLTILCKTTGEAVPDTLFGYHDVLHRLGQRARESNIRCLSDLDKLLRAVAFYAPDYRWMNE